MERPNRYSSEARERAVRVVFEHQREYDSQWGRWGDRIVYGFFEDLAARWAAPDRRFVLLERLGLLRSAHSKIRAFAL